MVEFTPSPDGPVVTRILYENDEIGTDRDGVSTLVNQRYGLSLNVDNPSYLKIADAGDGRRAELRAAYDDMGPGRLELVLSAPATARALKRQADSDYEERLGSKPNF